MAGPISFFTSHLVTVTEYSLAPNDKIRTSFGVLKRGQSEL